MTVRTCTHLPMTTDPDATAARPDMLLMLLEGVPAAVENEARALLEIPGLNLAVVHHPGGPYGGVELYLPSAIALFFSGAFFTGLMGEVSKDAYVALKAAAKALWTRSRALNVSAVASAPGKLSADQPYSLAWSMTGEVAPGLNFKFLIQTEIDPDDAEAGIAAFVDMIDDLIEDRMSKADVEALLTYQPRGGTVLVAWDATTRRIVPVDAFAGRFGKAPSK